MTETTNAILHLRSAARNGEAVEARRRACLDHASARGWPLDQTFVGDGSCGRSPGAGLLAALDRIRQERASMLLLDPLSPIVAAEGADRNTTAPADILATLLDESAPAPRRCTRSPE